MGWASVTPAITGTTSTLIQLKPGRSCLTEPALFLDERLDKCMPLLPSSERVYRKIAELSPARLCLIAGDNDLEMAAALTYLQQPLKRGLGEHLLCPDQNDLRCGREQRSFALNDRRH